MYLSIRLSPLAVIADWQYR